MREGDLLHLFVINGEQYHRPLQRLGLIGENIERAVVRIATLTPADFTKAQARDVRPARKVEQNDVVPIADASDQARIRLDARAALLAEEVAAHAVGSLGQRPRRQQGAQHRGAVQARVHVERDVLTACAGLVDHFNAAQTSLVIAAWD